MTIKLNDGTAVECVIAYLSDRFITIKYIKESGRFGYFRCVPISEVASIEVKRKLPISEASE